MVGAKGYIWCVCFKTVLHYSGWPCAPRCRQLAVSPSAPGHKEHFKEYLLERALAMDLSREIAIAVTSAKALVQQSTIENIVILKCQGMKGVRVVYNRGSLLTVSQRGIKRHDL